jgi:cell division protein FtsN
MSRTYYQIELSSTMMTVILVLLAGLLVAAFALGYGAAWSVLGGAAPGGPAARAVPSGPTRTPTPPEVVVLVPTPFGEAPTRAAAAGGISATPRQPTPRPATATPQPPPPAATATRTPPETRPTSGVDAAGTYWVQVLATSRRRTAEESQARLAELGFPPDHQLIVETTVAGGNRLFKVRVGPFPDRDSASRVMRRMRSSGFSDAWVVVP